MGKPSNHPGRSKPPCFTVKISTATLDNDNEGWRYEVARLLRSVAFSAYRTHETAGALYDRDGNRVGVWSYRSGKGDVTS